MTSKAFLIGAVAVVLAFVVAGIATVGGPGEGRREKFDQRRHAELLTIARALRCEDARISPPDLPTELTSESLSAHCTGFAVSAEALLDDETGDSYAYTRETDGRFSVCARFHDAARIRRVSYPRDAPGFAFDPETGCVTGQIR